MNDTANAAQPEDKPRWLQADELLNGIAEELRDRGRHIEIQIDRLVGERGAIERVLSRIAPSPPGAVNAVTSSAPSYPSVIVGDTPIQKRF